MTHADPPVSDNAETREAADRLRLLDALDDAWTACPHAVGFCRHCMHAVLAALPPVAGPEVRPDETLRALSEAATPGPWWTEGSKPNPYVYGMRRGGRPNGEGIAQATYYSREHDDSAADAAFIAAAANAVRAGLASPAPTDQEADHA